MKLSVCMMVKNEEKMLPRCLDSVKDIMDELIVVDTGSTDKTVEIAESYGARVYHHPWQNDFSYHRNQSIGYATGDWFLIIDADEELKEISVSPEEFRSRFKLLPENVTALVVTCHEKNQQGRIVYTWDSVRFFRSGVGIYFKGAVHNRAKYPGNCAPTDLELYHYGYHLDEKSMIEKEKRQRAMLTQELERNPEGHRALYYMSQMHLSYKRWQEGIDTALKCLDVLPIEDPSKLEFYGHLYYSCGLASIMLNKPDDARAWFEKGIELTPEHIDLYHGMSRLALMCEDNELLKENARKYFEMLPLYIDSPEEEKKFVSEIKRLPSSRGVFTAGTKAQGEINNWLKLAEVVL
jgi:tetratricopeptide (TPR) repeat protein